MGRLIALGLIFKELGCAVFALSALITLIALIFVVLLRAK
jgi:hypothetical protein